MSSQSYEGPIRVGQLRPSQLLHSFGVGALIDLPHLSVIVNGLHDWDPIRTRELREDRLLAVIRQRPGMSGVGHLRQPPWVPETNSPLDDWVRVGVPVAPFPRWLRCPWGTCQYLGPIADGQFRLDANPYRPDQGAYRHANCRKKGRGATAVPVRYLLACERGHLDEFPWVDYAHRRQVCDAPLLNMSERGLSSGPADVWVQCRTCDRGRPMSDAFGDQAARSLPRCRGHHPHLGRYDEDPCPAPVRALLLGASNAWFPDSVSVLSIPAGHDPVDATVAELWSSLEEIADRATLDLLLRRDPELRRLQRHDSADVWRAIEAHRETDRPAGGDADDGLDVLAPEWHQLTRPTGGPDGDDFRLRPEEPPPRFAAWIDQVARVERLREVVALTGFTRLSSPDELGAHRIAPLSRDRPDWVPAVEVRGEGVFLRLAETSAVEWEARFRETDRYERLRDAHRNWRRRRDLDDLGGWPGARYVLLHTLSHLLMRQMALDCGYAASSIRERIYARAGAQPMAGILLYTAAPDSEGTLGGLVSLGRTERLGELLVAALEQAAVCTSDPTCAEHRPGVLGDDHLHGAACHACLFASETSCERGNRYLDRGVLVATVDGSDMPYFARATTA